MLVGVGSPAAQPDLALMIRDEQPRDCAHIHAVTAAAFADMPFSDGDEPELVNHLRADAALTVSLVAEQADEIVGHIAFSPVRIGTSEETWFGLGPVSVVPALQSQGIGSALIRAGLGRIASLGAHGCVLLGHREYYRRFGFVHDPALTFAGSVNPAFQRLVLHGAAPVGEAQFHPAFYGA